MQKIECLAMVIIKNDVTQLLATALIIKYLHRVKVKITYRSCIEMLNSEF